MAKTPSVGYAVYDVRAGIRGARPPTLKVPTATSLENARYRVTLNNDGDVSSIFDKSLNKELLSAPVRLAISHDAPHAMARLEYGFGPGARRAARLRAAAGASSASWRTARRASP